MTDFRASNLFRIELMFNCPIISRFTLETLIPLSTLKGLEFSSLFSHVSNSKVSTSEKGFSKVSMFEERTDLLLSEAFRLSLGRLSSFSGEYSLLSIIDDGALGVPMLMGGGGLLYAKVVME